MRSRPEPPLGNRRGLSYIPADMIDRSLDPPVARGPVTRSVALRCLLAIAAVLAATILRWGLVKAFGPEPPFVLFYPAVLLVAILAGGGPGILAVVLCTVLAADGWTAPVRVEALPPATHWITVGVFVTMSLILCAAAEHLRRARRAEAALRSQMALASASTERRGSESERRLDAAHVEKERLSLMLSSIDEEVYFTDTQGRYLFANSAALREFGHKSVEGVEVKKVISHMIVLRADGTPRPMEEAPPLRALRGEVIRNEEQIVRTPRTGELRHRQVSATPVRDAGGQIIGSISVVRDITERKRVEEALREAERRKTDPP